MIAATVGVYLAAGASGDPVIDWLTQAGAVGALAWIVVLFLRGTLVRGKEVDLCREERDRALDLVFQLAETSRRALEVAKAPPAP